MLTNRDCDDTALLLFPFRGWRPLNFFLHSRINLTVNQGYAKSYLIRLHKIIQSIFMRLNRGPILILTPSTRLVTNRVHNLPGFALA